MSSCVQGSDENEIRGLRGSEQSEKRKTCDKAFGWERGRGVFAEQQECQYGRGQMAWGGEGWEVTVASHRWFSKPG
jgi:hypothetical protein